MNRCGRNGCHNKAMWSVLREIDGEYYTVDLCADHRDDFGTIIT